MQKTKQKGLRVSNSALFLVVVKRHRGSEGVKVHTGTAIPLTITAALQMASLAGLLLFVVVVAVVFVFKTCLNRREVRRSSPCCGR